MDNGLYILISSGLVHWNSKSRMVFYKNPNEQEKEISGDIFIDPDNEDFEFCKVYLNPEEQEKEMEVINTKVFEYCIINFDEDGVPYIATGPSVIAILGEENPRDVALLKIGCKHADLIGDDSEVQLRPFC